MNQWIKRFGQVMLSLLVGILVLSSGAGLIYAKSCKKLEAIKWTEEDIKINSSISSDHGIEMLYQGYFEQEISVGEETRTAKVYIPEGSDQ